MSKTNADSGHEFFSAFALETCVARLRGATKRGLRVDLNRVSADEYTFRAHGGLLHLNSVSGTLTRRGDATEVTTKGERDWLILAIVAGIALVIAFAPTTFLTFIPDIRELSSWVWLSAGENRALISSMLLILQIALAIPFIGLLYRLDTGHRRVARQINDLLTDVITDLPAAMQINAEGEIVSDAALVDDQAQQRQRRS